MGPCNHRLLMLLPGPNLPWAPVPPPHAAARPLICHGPLYRLLMLLARSTVCHGSLYTASHCCCLHRHTLPCATFQVSSHCWWVPFVIGYCMASHCCCPPPPHCGSTLWFWPRDCPNDEVCGDSKIAPALICMSY
ncbi:unnamed protein product [Staurois parvus]|uniref:Secreted protein n=1 Tax=Staurois parvus TaxID=386267 RepID=A0ABN9CAP4_9NEOB|nr:unnamed protein product [Staurois parvus]